MQINAELVAVGDAEAEVVVDEIEAGNLQPWMLLVAEEDTGHLHVTIGDPAVGHEVTEGGRIERWVSVPVFESEPVALAAVERVLIVYGTPPEALLELMPEDVLTVQEEALARNGLCHDRVVVHEDEDEPADDEQDEEPPLFCGRPSDPDSFYRACPEHDLVRREKSDELVRRGYEPTYGVLADIT